MKHQPIIIALLFAALALTFGAHAQLLSGSSLNASLLYYQPVPASPGSLLDVYVQINNHGDTATTVSVEFIDNGPFTLDNAADRIKSTDSIPGGQSFLLKYKVRVSQDAAPGTNNLKIAYSSGGGSAQETLLPIDVFSTTVALNVEDITIDPQEIAPGAIGTLSFQLRNAAPLRIRDGTVTLDLSNVNIIPVSATNQQRFTGLESGGVEQFSFKLSPSPDIAPGIYKIPIAINFSDQNGRQYQRTEYVGLRVGSTPDVTVTIDDTKLTTEQKTGDVIIRVTNKGLGQVKFVDVTVGKSNTFNLLSGSAERYVGNIDSDDYKTAVVNVEANGNTLEVPYTVTYMDALNTPYTKTGTLTVTLRSTKSGGIGAGTIIIALVVIGIVAYVIVRRRKKR